VASPQRHNPKKNDQPAKAEKAKATPPSNATGITTTDATSGGDAPANNEGASSTAAAKVCAVDITAIAPAPSFDSAKHLSVVSDDTASTNSDLEETEGDIKPVSKANSQGDFTVSRVHGVGTVVVAPSTAAEPTQPSGEEEKTEGATSNGEAAAATDDNTDEWETVEVKGRGNRKKASRTSSTASSQPSSGSNGGNGSKKSKSARTPASRKRLANRKIVKDILATVLDSVDEEVRRRRQQEARAARSAAAAAATPAAPVPSAWKEKGRTPGLVDGKRKEATLRDVVVGKQEVATPKRSPQTAGKTDAKAKVKSSSAQASTPSSRTDQRRGNNSSPAKGLKGQGADQNTAPTIPETVSAVSDARRTTPSTGRDITRSDSSSVDTDENRKQERASLPTSSGKTLSPEPPLPTLLNPGNVNSASSSVASSLEAPHAGHGHHHTSSSPEVDVGYHILDVCDRLTRDMALFMQRRASALSTRRRERGALLAALQDSVSVGI
jgi:hypothetical protein